jgi:hypothetical protein
MCSKVVSFKKETLLLPQPNLIDMLCITCPCEYSLRFLYMSDLQCICCSLLSISSWNLQQNVLTKDLFCFSKKKMFSFFWKMMLVGKKMQQILILLEMKFQIIFKHFYSTRKTFAASFRNCNSSLVCILQWKIIKWPTFRNDVQHNDIKHNNKWMWHSALQNSALWHLKQSVVMMNVI